MSFSKVCLLRSRRLIGLTDLSHCGRAQNTTDPVNKIIGRNSIADPKKTGGYLKRTIINWEINLKVSQWTVGCVLRATALNRRVSVKKVVGLCKKSKSTE